MANTSGQPYLYEDYALRREMSANVVGFSRFLRSEGLITGYGEQMDALWALDRIDLNKAEPFRMALRTTLAKSTREQEIFDEHFRRFWHIWESAEDFSRTSAAEDNIPAVRVIDERMRKPSMVSISDWLQDPSGAEDDRNAAGYSPFEVNTERDFSEFDQNELMEIAELINEIGKTLATRLSRRMRHSRRTGPMDIRRTLRQSLRRGGELIDLAHHHRKRQRLKLVLICDVSKSMDLYSRFLIQFIYAFQSVYSRIETFVFSTSLNRITEELRVQTMEEALARVSETVPEWSGGTKIGASLHQCNEVYGLKLVDSGTVVLIISDGWDTGEVDLLEDSMLTLHHRARSVIWLNPLKGSPDYQPSTRGMRAALPHLDLFASAHNLKSLRDLVHQLMKFQRN